MKKENIQPIEFSAKKVFKNTHTWFYVRTVFNALRANMQLLESPEYKRLYDEALDYLYRYEVKHRDWDENEREKIYETVIFLADLSNAHTSNLEIKFSKDEIDALLAERKKHWK